MRAARIDDNQNEIVGQLRSVPGLTVAITSGLGHGMGDFIIGWQGVNSWIELKDGDKPPSKRKLTPAERKFHAQWAGQIDVALTFEDCLRIIGVSTESAPF